MTRFIDHYAECYYAECRYADCHIAECRGALKEELTMIEIWLKKLGKKGLPIKMQNSSNNPHRVFIKPYCNHLAVIFKPMAP